MAPTGSKISVAQAAAAATLTCDSGVAGTKSTKGVLIDGFCKGHYSTDQDLLCHNLDKSKCTGKESGGVCSWKDSNSIYSYSGGLEGVIFNDWMKALGYVTIPTTGPNSGIPSPLPELSKVRDTSVLPLWLERYGNTNKIENTNKKAIDENFLHLIKVKTSTDVAGASAVPNNLKGEVENSVKDCEYGWDKWPKEYAGNGGGPIMGYNVSEGLVCKNPLNYPIVQPGGISRIHEGGDGYGCPSPNDKPCEKRTSPCNWDTSADGMAKRSGSLVYNNTPFSSSGECGLDSCAAEYPGYCLKDNIRATSKDAVSWLWESMPNPPQIF